MYYLNDQGERVYTLKVRATGDGRTRLKNWKETYDGRGRAED